MTNTPQTVYFSIISIAAIEKKEFSIVVANIDNTEDKRKLASELYPSEHYFFNYHDIKNIMNWVIKA